jgi:urease accessory protein
MYDAVSLSDRPLLQRAVGNLRVAMAAREGQTVLQDLREAGCLKVRFPRPDDPDWPIVVTLNTSGGVAGGDALDSVFTVGSGASATISSQAAERFYRALPGSDPSTAHTRIVVGEGGAAEWLPQETILFDQCNVRRLLQVELAEDAWFLGVEALVFGRTAMGEVVNRGWLHDVIEVRRGGRLLLRDAVRLDGEVAGKLQRKAIADGARAVATVICVTPEVDTLLEPLRSLHIGVSAWDGMLVARMLGSTGAALRSTVIEALQMLRGGRSLPRVWLC